VLDPAIAGDMLYLAELEEGISASSAGALMIRPGLWPLPRTTAWQGITITIMKKKIAQFLFTDRKQLEDKPLSRMIPVVIKSRDGRTWSAFILCLKIAILTETEGQSNPFPLCFLVHGGPWSRDYWGLEMHQWSVNRGYAVLAVNFRGSTGFGRV